MNRIHDALHESAIGRFSRAYQNPRLENPEVDYLDQEHIEELRDQSEITVWDEDYWPETIEGVGTIHRVRIVTKQGLGYRGAWGIPETQRTSSLGLATGPLGTSEPGFNRHLMINYMRAGNYVGFMTAEGRHDTTLDHRTRMSISLASTAAALLNYGYHLGKDLADQGHDLEQEDRFTYGSSHAGAVAILLNTIDSEFDQNIRSTDAIAPSPSIKLNSPEQWRQVAEQIVKEPAQAAYIISRLGLKLALRYRKSLTLNTANMSRQLEICGGLFNGELDVAATRVPGDKVIRITEYDCDLACNDGGLENRLTPSTHPNITFEELRGIHMSIADRNKTLPVMMGFNKAYQEFEAGQLSNADELFRRARELAPRQFPVTKAQIPPPPSLKIA